MICDELSDRFLRPIDRLVADDDRVDVAIAPARSMAALDFPLVARLVLVDPDADRDLEPELRRDAGHQFAAAGRAVGADRLRVGREHLQIGPDLLLGRAITTVRDAASACRASRRRWPAALRYWRSPGAVGAMPTSRHARRQRTPPQQRRCAWKANHARQESRDRTRPLGSTKIASSVPQLRMFVQVANSHGAFKEHNRAAKKWFLAELKTVFLNICTAFELFVATDWWCRSERPRCPATPWPD